MAMTKKAGARGKKTPIKSAARKVAKKAAAPPKSEPILLVATRKGAFLYCGDSGRRKWQVAGPHHLGSICQHMVQDPRNRKVILLAAGAGHLGPTVFRSTNQGRSWKEAEKPPAFASDGDQSRTVKRVFWLTPGHSSQPGVWYASTSPDGLFRSEDGGVTWAPVSGFNDHPMRSTWTKDGEVPGGILVHSINVDPRDPNHLYLSISVGGVFESWDGGGDWQPLNRGIESDFLPKREEEYEYGQDPHCVIVHPARPDRLWMQNHCGIYRLDRDQNERWVRVGKKMPKLIGDVGFPIVTHPLRPDTAWVFPMDGTSVWPRTSPGGKPSAYVTRDGGKSWQRQDKGLPKEHAWWTVRRQAMANDQSDPLGLYFGTTSGELWMSRNEGASWERIAEHLPEILAVEVGLR